MRTKAALLTMAMALLVLGATASFGAPAAEPVYGGVLKVTLSSHPSSLDPILEGSENEQIPAGHIFETALATDPKGDPFPSVCTYETKEDGKVVILSVREGVRFHDGSVVKIEDVEASTKRWLNHVGFAKSHVGGKLDKVSVENDKLVFTFRETSPLALTAISSWKRGLYIFPKAVCEKYPDSKIENADLIGTGPYQFKDDQSGRFVILEKFKDYVPYDSGGTGLAAAKKGYVEELHFYPVADRTARFMGVQTGEYDIGIGVPSNMIESMQKDPNLYVEIKELGIMPCAIFNFKEGRAADENLRNAILACLDMDELMMAAQGDESLYYLNPSIMPKSSRWWTGESLGKYNNPDLTKAKEYLKKSNYDGKPLVFITSKANDYFYKTALMIQQMVKPAGIEIELQIYDNPTLQQYRNQPDKFDIFSAGLTAKVDPTLVAFMEDGWAGFYSSERKAKYYDIMTSVSDFDTRYGAWVEMTKVLYEEVPVITMGERTMPVVARSYVHDLFDTNEKYYWNTWVKK